LGCLWCLITIPLLSYEVALRGPYLPGSRRGPNNVIQSKGGWRSREG
jgi:hypothetical protein